MNLVRRRSQVAVALHGAAGQMRRGAAKGTRLKAEDHGSDAGRRAEGGRGGRGVHVDVHFADGSLALESHYGECGGVVGAGRRW